MAKSLYLDQLARQGINGAHPGGLALTRLLLRNERLNADMALLDVGCGTGQTAAYIAGHYPCKVTAADINPMMLEKARRNFANYQLKIPLIQADVMDLPFPNNAFDLVLAESVTVFTDIGKTFGEYYRVLKPGGILLDIEATALTPLNRDETADFQAVLGIKRLPARDEWRQMIQDAGFRDIRVLVERRMNWLQSLSPKMNRDFKEYAGVLFHYRNKFGYGVYRSVKE